MSETTNLKLFKHNKPLESNTNKFDVDKALNQNWDKIDNYVGETNKKLNTLETDNSTNKTNISNLEENKVDKVKGKGLSTEDFTTELKSKLESLENYDDTEIKEDISNLESEQTEQDKQIDILLNALPTETQEGENINLKGTIPVKFKEFKLSGNSKQETRSGKNLLKNNLTDTTINGVTFKINEDKSITVNGTATANIIANLVSGQYNDNNADEPLTIPDNVTNLRLSGCPTGGSSSTYKLDLYNSDYILLATDFGNGTSVIIPEENKNISRARIIIYSGATVNNLTFKPMLEKGTTATDYEPYGAMPSPEFPSPIQNVEGDVNVTVANKEKTEQQTVTFPLAQGQKLMLGDYLAADGIHHKRKQIELDGTNLKVMGVYLYSNGLYYCTVGIPFKSINGSKVYSTHFKGQTQNIIEIGNSYVTANGGTLVFILEDQSITTVADANNWLIQQKEQGTLVKFECELAEEEIEAYTEEQQEAYNQICNLKAYEEETNVYSKNEVSPIFKVTAVKDINSVITQLNTVLLERS